MEKVLVVGAGLTGATIANLFSRDSIPVVVIDKRDHIAGNVYDEIDPATGIRVSRYGAHIFHTDDKEVWNYLQEFGTWIRWDHRVLADVSGQMIPLPITIETVNRLFGEAIQTENEMREWLELERVPDVEILTSEDIALSRVGIRLYKILFAEYTRKQWAKDARELDPSVLARIPVRASFDTRYFSDRYQAMPKDGYTSIVRKMLDHPLIDVKLDTDWDAVRDQSWKTVIFTGPIDGYFKESGLPPLEYRSIQFEWERLPCKGYAQPNSVVNYPGAETPYTRCVEYKHFLHQKSDWTVLSREITCAEGEPYYPVPTQANQDLYRVYKELAEKESGVHFVGRLASYKYFNMDQAVRNAIDYYRKFLKGK
jgi:UDP-galactopyranose mutase